MKDNVSQARKSHQEREARNIERDKMLAEYHDIETEIIKEWRNKYRDDTKLDKLETIRSRLGLRLFADFNVPLETLHGHNSFEAGLID